MQALSRTTLRLLPRTTKLQNCRWIGGRRQPQSRRAFAASSRLRKSDNDPTNSEGAAVRQDKGLSETPEESREETEDQDNDREALESREPTQLERLVAERFGADVLGDAQVKVLDKGSYGSFTRRATRNVPKPKELALPKVPDWFLERNVLLWQDLSARPGNLNVVPNTRLPPRRPPQKATAEDQNKTTTTETSSQPASVAGLASKGVEDAGSESQQPKELGYEIDELVLEEIMSLATAGLQFGASRQTQNAPASKQHLVLQSPKGGGDFFLTSVVEHVAHRLEADVVKVDAQDIAELVADPSLDLPPQATATLRSLGYDTYSMEASEEDADMEEAEDREDVFEDDEDESPMQRGKPIQLGGASKGVPQLKFLPLSLSDILKSAKAATPGMTVHSIQAGQLDVGNGRPNGSAQKAETPEISRASLVYETFLNSAQAKRQAHNGDQGALGSRNLVVLIQDYLEISTAPGGSVLLNQIHEAVEQRRKAGQRVIIIGTSSSEDLVPSMSVAGFKTIQIGTGQALYRTVITPCNNEDVEALFLQDERNRVQQINVRHIKGMLAQVISESDRSPSITVPDVLDFDSAQVFAYHLDDTVWTYDRVHRLANTTLGVTGTKSELATTDVVRALEILDASDSSKFAWLHRDKESEGQSAPGIEAKPEVSKRVEEEQRRLRKLRKTCNSHEKKLLNGVIQPDSLHTSFEDVRVEPSTIESIKTLTSLSLIRPEAFTYGVLATDKIPGLLLYGPPGTGKTLLAKAVAKQSGATMLEVSGSDIYDMYVGESEKNVRAIFTLAKKLSPCVVFIDEADAILGSRNTSGSRTSHRELINQFLREWDGMNDLSAFIMVATNRPFDLDDAVLRRLPRRLLVDLPTEKDREVILAIHLKGEALDQDVSFERLASQTPFYSGSDLKNLAVAAALACVREENEAAARHTGDEPYTYPERRTLTAAHFDKALQEITASISEDMSSLAAIRKFDEKYGDRRARKKKAAGGYGFGTLTEKDRERMEEGRVRKTDVAAPA